MGLAGFLAAVAAAVATFTINHHHSLRGGSTVSNCDTASLFQYDSGSLNPPNPLPNTNTTLILTFTNNFATIADGTIDYSVNLNGLPYTYSEPLCSPNMACPIELGQHTVYSNPIDVGTTTGKLVITTNYKDSTGNKLLCVKTSMNLPNSAANQKALVVRYNHESVRNILYNLTNAMAITNTSTRSITTSSTTITQNLRKN